MASMFAPCLFAVGLAITKFELRSAYRLPPAHTSLHGEQTGKAVDWMTGKAIYLYLLSVDVSTPTNSTLLSAPPRIIFSHGGFPCRSPCSSSLYVLLAPASSSFAGRFAGLVDVGRLGLRLLREAAVKGLASPLSLPIYHQ